MDVEHVWSEFDWSDRLAIVTGGAGFLGSQVVAALRARGLSDGQIIVPRQVDYDLRREDAIERLFAGIERTGPSPLGAPFDMQRAVLIHLAGNVGGIGYNRAHPG